MNKLNKWYHPRIARPSPMVPLAMSAWWLPFWGRHLPDEDVMVRTQYVPKTMYINQYDIYILSMLFSSQCDPIRDQQTHADT